MKNNKFYQTLFVTLIFNTFVSTQNNTKKQKEHFTFPKLFVLNNEFDTSFLTKNKVEEIVSNPNKKGNLFIPLNFQNKLIYLVNYF